VSPRLSRATISYSLASIVQRGGLILVILALWVFFSVAAEGFASAFNLFALSRAGAIAIVVALSQMVVMSIGGMNLAVGAIGGLVAIFSGTLMTTLGIPWPLAAVVALGFATLLGAINGILIVTTRISGFIITLATASMYHGAIFITTKSDPIPNLPEGFVWFGRAQVANVSPLVFVLLLTATACYFLYRNTDLGHQMLATGANARAARLSGVPVDRVVLITHSLSGMLAGLAGLMMASRLASAIPLIGEDWVLPSFAAAAIGGTLLTGGVVSVVGTVLGGILVETVRGGLTLMSAASYWVGILTGLVLLAAILFDRARARFALDRASAQRPEEQGVAEGSRSPA
jgi:ribose transport system permease protein